MTTEIKNGNFTTAGDNNAFLPCCMEYLNGKHGKAFQVSLLVRSILETLNVAEEEVHIRLTAKDVTCTDSDGAQIAAINDSDDQWKDIAANVNEILVRVGNVWDKCSPTHGGKSSSSGGPGKGTAHGKHGGGDGSDSGGGQTYNHCTFNCCGHHHGHSSSHSGLPVTAASFVTTNSSGLKGPSMAGFGKSFGFDDEDGQAERIRELEEELQHTKEQARAAKQQLDAIVDVVGDLEDDVDGIKES